MNFVIFKDSLSKNFKLILIFMFVLCFYQSAIISIVDLGDMAGVSELFSSFDQFLAPIGINIAGFTSPLNYIASVFYSMLIMGFTMVYYVLTANSLIAKPVSNKSISTTLSLPVKRFTLALTKGIYLIFAMALLFLAIFLSGSLFLSFKSEFPILDYVNLNGVTFCLCTFVAMVAYFLSVLFCNSPFGSRLCVGVPITLLFMSVLGGGIGEKGEWLKNITPFGWLDSVGIVSGEVSALPLYIFFSIGIVALLFLSAAVFTQKDLAI